MANSSQRLELDTKNRSTRESSNRPLSATVTNLLDGWDQRIRIDVDVDGCRLQVAAMGARMYVEYIAVLKALRRGGYGTAMLFALTAWADRHGLTLELGVSTDYGMRRTTLTRLYAAHGFCPSGPVVIVRQPTPTAVAA